MNKKSLVGALAIIVLGLIIWFFTAGTAAKQGEHAATSTAQSAQDTMGTYAYECDEHVGFTMTPASDMGSIAIAPTNASSTYPPAVTVYKEPASSGVRYVGGGILFSARGETVTLSQGDSAINCSPVPDQENAPFNFGD